MKSMFVLFLIGTLFTVGLQALQCYKCGVLSIDPTFQTGDDAACSSTQTSQMNTCNTTGQCLTTKAANIVVQLTCSDACVQLNALGTGSWCCRDTDLCNAAPTSTYNVITMVSTVILAVMATYHL